MSFKSNDKLLKQLFLENEKWLYFYIYEKVNDQQLAKDLLQEVFIRVYKQKARYDERGFAKAWLKNIAHNLCIDHFRTTKVNELVSLSKMINTKNEEEQALELSHTLEGDYLPDNILEKKQLSTNLVDAINKLPDKQRQVMILRFFGERTIEEIGKRLNIPEGTVKSRIYYSTIKLKELMANYLIDGDFVISCEDMKTNLPAYSANLLSQQRIDDVKKHLSICENCKANSQIFNNIFNLLNDFKNNYRFLLIIQPIDNNKKLVYSRSVKILTEKERNYLKEKGIYRFKTSSPISLLSIFDHIGNSLEFERITPRPTKGKKEPNPIRYRVYLKEIPSSNLTINMVSEGFCNITKRHNVYEYKGVQQPCPEAIQDYVLVLNKEVKILFVFPKKYRIIETGKYKLIIWTKHLEKNESLFVKVLYEK